MKKRNIFIFLFLLVVGFINIETISAYMLRNKDCDYTTTQTLASKVSGTVKPYRLLYYSTSSYTTQITNSENKWHAMGKVMIIKSLISSNKDVTISDYTKNDNVLGVTNYKDMTIKFNKYNFNNMSAEERSKTVLHEFGHALGLDHMSTSKNVMKQGIFGQTSLGTLDKSTYNCYWS